MPKLLLATALVRGIGPGYTGNELPRRALGSPGTAL